MLNHVPILAVQRELYRLPRGLDRFRRYLGVMTGGTDDIVLPLVGMNPMARDHVTGVLDQLLAVDAERVAAAAVNDAERRLGRVDQSLRVGLVVADDVAGGWTDRELIEANRLRSVPHAMLKRGWLAVTYWASMPVSAGRVREEVLAAVFRDLFLQRHRGPTTLRAMMALEGAALSFAGATEPALDDEELAYTREVVRPYLDSRVVEDFPATFTCLYGDPPARRVGYSALGLSARAGCALALAEAAECRLPPEVFFAAGWTSRQATSIPVKP